MKIIRIDIGKDFSDVPSGRYEEDGDFNGTKFRTDFLVPALRSADQVEVNLDSTEGFGSSFLEEAFGGLIRNEGFSKKDLDQKLIVISKVVRTQRYKRKIDQYIDRAEMARKGA